MLSDGETQRETDERRVVGRSLREAREARGLSLEQVQQVTKVHAHHLGALERGDYEALPDPGWARGCLVLYAGHLGMDGARLADRVAPLQRPSLPERFLRRHWRATLAVAGTFAVAAVLFLATVIAPYNPITKAISDGLRGIAPGIFLGSEPQRIALLGVTDSGSNAGGGVLVVRVAADGLGVLSIPRDTTTRVPGYGRSEIGETADIDEPDQMLRSVSRLTNERVEYYCIIRPDGIREIVGSANGVRVDVPKATSGRAVPGGPIMTLRPGPQTLDGDQALVYLQGNDLQTDADRAKRQQAFLYAMFRQALGPSNVLTNPAALSTGRANIETNMSSVQMLQLAARVKDLKDSGAAPEMETYSGRADAASVR